MKIWNELGRRTVYSIAEYLQLSTPKYIILDNKDAQLIGNWSSETSGLLYFGDDYVTAEGGSGNNSITYKQSSLVPGNMMFGVGGRPVRILHMIQNLKSLQAKIRKSLRPIK